MAVFTTTSKNRLSWQAPASGDYVSNTEYTNVQKTRLSWQSPETTSSSIYLDIGSGFNLLVANGYKLVIQSERGAAEWTTRNKYT
jgi:hypothetical protein